MTSNRSSPHRRRSLSSSSSTNTSPLPRRSPEDSWRVATKRAHHANLPVSASARSPRRWDADFRRKSKRVRRSYSPSDRDTVAEFVTYGTSAPSVPHRSCSSPARPVFPSTSADFHLYPKHATRRRNPSGTTLLVDAVPSDADILSDQLPPPDLTHLRSQAFGELQRSVAENGEGFVRRMRDFEDSRSGVSLFSETHRRGRKGRMADVQAWETLGRASEPDEDEDVQIYAGEIPPPGSRQKRAASLGLMDLDTYLSDVLSSPGATCASLHSDLSDDEPFCADADCQINDDPLSPSPCISPSAVSFTPALSHTYSASTNSSLTSLPLPPPFHSIPSAEPMPMSSTRSGFPLAIPSSRSEKAIAALTLAMANGAGGLNDYEALRVIYHPTSDCYHVGELWH